MTPVAARRATLVAVVVLAAAAVAFVVNGGWLLAFALEHDAASASDLALFDTSVALNGFGGTAVVLSALAGVLMTRDRRHARNGVLLGAAVLTVLFIGASQFALRPGAL